MKKKQHITAFYLETLLMIAVFVSIILVLTRVFGSARAQSAKAKNLTAAVTLAQNAAEAVSASKSPQDLLALLGTDGNALLQEDASTGEALVTAVYDTDLHPVPIPGGILPEAQRSPAAGADPAQAEQAGEGGRTETVAEQTGGGAGLPQAEQEEAGGGTGLPQVEPGKAGAGTEPVAELLRIGDLIVETAWKPVRDRDGAGSESGEDAAMVNAVIIVFDGNTGEAVFSLQTAVWPAGN